MLRRHFIINTKSSISNTPNIPNIPNNEIWYTSSNGDVVYPITGSLPPIDSNTYNNGKGIIKFETDVTIITNNAFVSKSTLTSIVIPNSVISIESTAFVACYSLTSITIPNSVTSIGDNALGYCTSLTSITYTGTIFQWNTIAKSTNWNENIPATVVHCTDGDVEI